eukprot:CAMPEP_0118690102 /NCGR_PEP_ID=MMETSP0800-20121206/9889_1 /TAXON_ID=210618 ORGANISM="Striatella unipunctata, Strain CCMP2910" /NCGR_SAMPLE_ID=MMETSP0800 /ASSEMBLY_ACC=CAM_ASM_000638 /LENGTH=31 /DNA_ID= /DNA_START= /DNA_END= /DNA_ORIENTATION=
MADIKECVSSSNCGMKEKTTVVSDLKPKSTL